MKKIVQSMFVYAFIVFVVTFVFGFVTSRNMQLLEGAETKFRLFSALLLFFEFLPSTLAAAFLVGASVGFGEYQNGYAFSFSPAIMSNFRTSMIIAAVCALILMAVAEIGNPKIKLWQKTAQENYVHYNEYIELTRINIAAQNPNLAFVYASSALKLQPDSEEALSLYRDAELRKSESHFPADSILIGSDGLSQDTSAPDVLTVTVETVPPTETKEAPADNSAENAEITVPIIPNLASFSSLELLEQAQEAFATGDWFKAHYYAHQITETGNTGGPNYSEAMRLSSEAWNKITAPNIALDPEGTRLFERKFEAYSVLISGDILRAYYLLRVLTEAYPSDNDIDMYYHDVQNRMERMYFFVEEIPDVLLFGSVRNVYFSYRTDVGGTKIISIDGIASLQNTGGIVQYLQDLTVYSFDKEGALENQYTTPYAKVFSQDMQGRRVPYILLTAVDTESEGIVSFPTGTAQNTIYDIFDIPYDDFLNIISVSSLGVDLMNLWDLSLFIKKAPLYGFSSEVLLQAFISRIFYPLVIMVVLMLTASIGWLVRLDSNVDFKFKWVLLLPILNVVFYFALIAVDFASKLCNYAIIGLSQNAAVPVSGVLLFLLLLCFSVLFASLHDHQHLA